MKMLDVHLTRARRMHGGGFTGARAADQGHRRHGGRGRVVHDARQGADGGRPRRTLKGPGPFTVFAPTDEAFAKLPAGTLDNLLKPENKAMLRRVLTYHVVPGKVMAADVVKVSSAKAVSGDTLSIKVSGGTVMVDKARVVKTDIAASNWRHPRHRHRPASAGRIPETVSGRNHPAHRRQRIHRQPPSSSARGRRLRGAVPRAAARARRASRATTEVVAGDCLDEASLSPRPWTGWIRPITWCTRWRAGPGFAALDRQAAANFGRAAARAGVRRIIYLGGLGDSPDSLSTHLKSRLETGEALREAGVPVVEFRASIVIGAGSLSFEMIRALVERLPVMICPRWVDTRT